ncbi:MAG: homoserine dehydrogenase [Gemmataceae bacterium]|nr:homoserine dehydrogenase [Gemmataceae bacterium]MDW8266855.1 homoserine dehydrogenase [Gemmataceae bacterium]
MAEPFGIGLLGCGTVGSGVAKLLLEQPGRLAARAGRPLVLRRVVVRDPRKPRDVALPPGVLTTDLGEVLGDPAIQCVAELVGGTTWARQAVLQALAAGKHVVTANKALLAEHGAEVFATARRHGRAVAFEASVGGGIPIIAALSQGLAANQITSLQGILNGTCNFILTGMTENGSAYADVLAEAQRRGYAEADPTLDVNGTDTAQKLAILAHIAFGVDVLPSAIECRGIADMQQADLRFAQELGYTVKLLAEAWLRDGQLALHVSPVLVRRLTPLAQVRGAYNAIHVVGDAVGDTLYYGRGAGQMPTASAVVADLIDMAIGRAQRSFQTSRLWAGQEAGITLLPAHSVRSRFYLRLLVVDQPGVMAEVTRVLAQHHISIASVVQHESLDEHEGDTVPLVIMTHTTLTGHFRAAVAGVDRLPCVMAPSVYYPVAD